MSQTEPPSVFFVIHSFDVGGAQRSVMATAAAWPNEWQCGIITARGGALLDEARHAAPTRVVAPKWPQPLAIGLFLLKVRSITREERPIAFLTNSFGISRVMLLLKKLGALGDSVLVVVERNTFSIKVAGNYQSRLLALSLIHLTRWLYRSADSIIGVSEGVSRDLERALGLPTNTVTTIRNPIDGALIRAAVNSQVPLELEAAFGVLARPIILTAGRMVAAKAQDDLLRSFARLPDHLRGSLVILGDGPLRSDLEQQADLLGISDRIWMPGFVDNPWWFIARSDVFALSSHWEGHPRAILEALACNVPIASTDCPSGPREILCDARGTRLTPVGDTHALAEAIKNLLTDAQCPDIDLTPYEPAHVARRYLEVVQLAQRSVLGHGSSPA